MYYRERTQVPDFCPFSKSLSIAKLPDCSVAQGNDSPYLILHNYFQDSYNFNLLSNHQNGIHIFFLVHSIFSISLLQWLERDFIFTVNNLFSIDPSFLQRKSIGGKWKVLQIIDAQTIYSHNLGLIITITESIFLMVKERKLRLLYRTFPQWDIIIIS